MEIGCIVQVPHAWSADVQVWRVNLDEYPQVGAANGLTADEVARVQIQSQRA